MTDIEFILEAGKLAKSVIYNIKKTDIGYSVVLHYGGTEYPISFTKISVLNGLITKCPEFLVRRLRHKICTIIAERRHLQK